MTDIKRASGGSSGFNLSLMDDIDAESLVNCLVTSSNETIVSTGISAKIKRKDNGPYSTDIIGEGWGSKGVKSKLSEDRLKMYETNEMIPPDVFDIACKMRAFVIVNPKRTSSHSNYYLKAYKQNKSYQEIKNIIETNEENRFRINTTLWLLKYKQ